MYIQFDKSTRYASREGAIKNEQIDSIDATRILVRFESASNETFLIIEYVIKREHLEGHIYLYLCFHCSRLISERRQ